MLQTQSPFTFQNYFMSGQGNPNTLIKAPKGARYLDVGTGDVYIKTTGASSLIGWGINGDIIEAVAAGTVYTLTATSAAVDFGTTDPVIVIPYAGRWRLQANVQLDNVGASYAASRTVTLKLRRTNNTPADILTATSQTGVITTLTSSLWNAMLGPVNYDTNNTDDSITVFADVSTLPSAGSSTVYACRITATYLGVQL